MKKTPLLLCCCFIQLLLFAQPASFSPLSNDKERDKALLQAAEGRLQQDVAALKGDHKQPIAELYKERFGYLKEKIEKGEVVIHPEAEAYLKKLAGIIGRANPSLDLSGLRILFTRSYLPNAVSLGEGTILFHIGLFHRLENESQAAFVLCHELAHFYLDHGNRSIERYVQTVHSKEFQEQLKEIKKSEYRQNGQLEQLAKGVTFRSRRHGRAFEEAADSFAVELMKGTGYSLSEARSALALLDSVDRPKYNKPLDLSRIFHFEGFPFRSRWLERDDPMFAITTTEEEKEEADSLKTHPDCGSRMIRIEGLISRHDKPAHQKFLISPEQFGELKAQFDFELLEHCFRRGQLSRALYLTLKMLEDRPGEPYLHALVGRCLNGLYDAQKRHELSHVADLPDPTSTEKEYDSLLQLIQNLRLGEIAQLSYRYLEKHLERGREDEAYMAAFISSLTPAGREAEKGPWITYFKKQFPHATQTFQ